MTELLRLSLADRSQLERFVHEHWNRGPCKLVTAPLISHQTGFDTVIGYSSVHAGEALVRVWAEDQFVYFPRDVIFIERPADRTFHGWAHRNAVHIMTFVLFSLLAFVMFIQVAC